jgi:pSer/pThr/pTyr-binding forkhead associated (FHA) protein
MAAGDGARVSLLAAGRPVDYRLGIGIAQAMKAELVPENGDPAIRIDRDVTLVGRHESCDVVIDHPGLSKRHCVLVRTDGLLVIRDLVTTNGTKVKGQRIRWAALLPEDRLSLGGYKVRVYLGSDEMPSPSELRKARTRVAEPPLLPRDTEPVAAGITAPAFEVPAMHIPGRRSPGEMDDSPDDSADSAEMGEGLEILDDLDDEIIELD